MALSTSDDITAMVELVRELVVWKNLAEVSLVIYYSDFVMFEISSLSGSNFALILSSTDSSVSFSVTVILVRIGFVGLVVQIFLIDGHIRMYVKLVGLTPTKCPVIEGKALAINEDLNLRMLRWLLHWGVYKN